jgi:hypothetical protein
MPTIKPHFWHFIVMLLLLSSSEITLYLCLQLMSSSITKSQIRPLQTGHRIFFVLQTFKQVFTATKFLPPLLTR